MKKLFSLLTAFIIATSISACASDIEIQATMNAKPTAQDRVWVGSFQLAWNDFMDKIVFHPIRFREGTPIMVNELNKKAFTTSDISESSYYKYTGKVKKNTKKTIEKGIRKKFKENSDMLDKLELTHRNDMYVIYSMLNKKFEFVKEFEKLGRYAFGAENIAEYFGVNKYAPADLTSGIRVLFYNDPNDYAIVLNTTGKDYVFLYKNSANKPFNQLYIDMKKKEKAYTGKTEFKTVDELRIPNISFFEEASYEELSNKRVMGTNLTISKALQTVKFNMDNKGVKLKSEAGLTAVTTSLLPPEELVPRLFYFDNTFVMFLKEKDKTKPYFALRVNDITKFQKK